MAAEYEHLDGETAWRGRIGSVRVERFRHADGEVVEREIMRHPGAVAIVAHDDLHLWLVRQPREAVGSPDLLELPAGKIEPGEDRFDTARRELAEEVGKAALSWEHLGDFWVSPGFTDERIGVWLATDLREAQADSGENERIEVVPWPLESLEEAIDACEDAKSLIGLLWFRGRLRA
ncbi:MAG: NUDIX hydrolase [Solirubrobacteraceae bacterium]